jgi:hypothetical protein
MEMKDAAASHETDLEDLRRIDFSGLIPEVVLLANFGGDYGALFHLGCRFFGAPEEKEETFR